MSGHELHLHPGDPGMGKPTHGNRSGLGEGQAPREGDGANQPGQEDGIRPSRPDGIETEGMSPERPASMPRAIDHPGGLENSQEFHDRSGGLNPSDPVRRD